MFGQPDLMLPADPTQNRPKKSAGNVILDVNKTYSWSQRKSKLSPVVHWVDLRIMSLESLAEKAPMTFECCFLVIVALLWAIKQVSIAGSNREECLLLPTWYPTRPGSS